MRITSIHATRKIWNHIMFILCTHDVSTYTLVEGIYCGSWYFFQKSVCLKAFIQTVIIFRNGKKKMKRIQYYVLTKLIYIYLLISA